MEDTSIRFDLLDELYRRYEEANKNNKILLMNIGNNTYTINELTINRISNLYLEDKIDKDFIKTSDADFENVIINEEIEDVTFEEKERPQNYSNGGAFFSYINDTNYDLSQLQIYNIDQLKTLKEQTPCLIHSLEAFGIDTNVLRNKDNCPYVDRKDLQKIANLTKTKISLLTYNNDCIGNGNTYYYCPKGIKHKHEAKICCFKDHYFPIIDLPITKFSIDHYELIKDRNNFNQIKRINRYGKYAFEGNQTRRSNLVIRDLCRKGYLNQRHGLLTKFCDMEDEIILSNIEDEQKPIKLKRKKNKQLQVFYADIESYLDKNKKHIPYLFGLAYSCRTPSAVEGEVSEAALQTMNITQVFTKLTDMLNHILDVSANDRQIVIYFHNAKYDYSVAFDGMQKLSECYKGGMLYSSTIKYGHKTIEIRDSYKHISQPLSRFKLMYNLESGKKDDYTPYELYNKDNVNKLFIPLSELLAYDENGVNEHTKPYIRGNRFFHMNFMKEYLKYDVLTLQEGFMKHREFMLELTGEDIFNHLTTSSVVDEFYKKKGVYDDVFAMKGNLRKFVMSAMTGGRVATRLDKKYDIKIPVSDFDAVSLYPSAMSVMKGFPKGKAKIMSTDFISLHMELSEATTLGGCKADYDNYWIAEILVKKVNKRQQIPFINYKENGKRKYDDSIENKRLIVDKITLEDYIKFHDIEYEFIRGVEWTEGYNNKINEIIKYLFNARLEAKKLLKETGNKRFQIKQELIKLIMNSSYGKTLVKENNKKIVFKNKNMFNSYFLKNYNTITKYTEFKNQYRIEKRISSYEHYNRAHCGVYVLSQSKRIMNEVMDVANDNDIKIFYQDTDSMHMLYDDVEKLAKLYKEEYNKELIGTNLCQFHNDLELNGAPTYSERCIILGKKCYIDLLHGNIEVKNRCHIRMKGVGSKAVLANYDDPIDLYEHMLEGESKKFDLLKSGVKFDVKLGDKVITKDLFTRELSFDGPVEYIA